MKVHILGSRNRPYPGDFPEGATREEILQWGRRRCDNDSARLSIDVEMDHVPQRGERIIIDGGSCYAVMDITYFVNTDQPYRYNADLKGNGETETVHVFVEPYGTEHTLVPHNETYTAGKRDGRAELVSELAELVTYAGAAFGTDPAELPALATGVLAGLRVLLARETRERKERDER